MTSVSQVESVEFDLERFVERPNIYVIASQPRSGSHYLAQLLRDTGVAGVPLEYFHSAHWKRWVKRCGQGYPLAAFRVLCQLRTSPNGAFGVKMHWKQFQLACRLRLEGEFASARWIQITRDDLLGQAISLVIASQTGAWIHDHSAVRKPEYSYAAIKSAVSQLTSERQHWDQFFAITGIDPLRISYEQLTQHRDGIMAQVCEHIGIAWDDSTTVETKVQRTERSDEWRERFLSTAPLLHQPDLFWRSQFAVPVDTGPFGD